MSSSFSWWCHKPEEKKNKIWVIEEAFSEISYIKSQEQMPTYRALVVNVPGALYKDLILTTP